MSQRYNRLQAVALCYNGLEPNRVEAFDSANPVFFVSGPVCDVEIILQEMNDTQTTVFLSALLQSVARIDALIGKARPSGVWQKPKEDTGDQLPIS
jgi:hypothetical protein